MIVRNYTAPVVLILIVIAIFICGGMAIGRTELVDPARAHAEATSIIQNNNLTATASASQIQSTVIPIQQTAQVVNATATALSRRQQLEQAEAGREARTNSFNQLIDQALLVGLTFFIFGLTLAFLIWLFQGLIRSNHNKRMAAQIKLEDLNVQLIQADATLNRVQSSIRQADNRLLDRKNELKRQTRHLNMAILHIGELSQTIQQAEARLKALRVNVIGLERINSDLLSRIETLEKESSALAVENQASMKDKELLAKELDLLKIQKKGLEDDIKRLQLTVHSVGQTRESKSNRSTKNRRLLHDIDGKLRKPQKVSNGLKKES